LFVFEIEIDHLSLPLLWSLLHHISFMHSAQLKGIWLSLSLALFNIRLSSFK